MVMRHDVGDEGHDVEVGAEGLVLLEHLGVAHARRLAHGDAQRLGGFAERVGLAAGRSGGM